MRFIDMTAVNFISYDNLYYKFNNDGLTLIEGASGAGKSSFCDVLSWTLYGKTPKQLTGDSIKKWDSDGKPTTGTVNIEYNSTSFTVVRTRGNSSQNDLYLKVDDKIVRGKDLKDTQNIINERIGIDYDPYIMSSYSNEFTNTSEFFTASVKIRRTIMENVIDLSSFLKLQEIARRRTSLLAQFQRNYKMLNLC